MKIVTSVAQVSTRVGLGKRVRPRVSASRTDSSRGEKGLGCFYQPIFPALKRWAIFKRHMR